MNVSTDELIEILIKLDEIELKLKSLESGMK